MRNEPTRREFLGAAAGFAALALRGQEAPPRRIPIRFVGDGLERGHHWFIPDPESLHVDRREKRAVVIVGGGIAGCVAAWRLLSASVEDVVVLEVEDVAGGLARRGLMGATAVAFGGVTMAAANLSRPVARLLERAGVDRSLAAALALRVHDGGAWKPWDPRPASLPESRPHAETRDGVSVGDWLAA